jgi:hypothetical protein
MTTAKSSQKEAGERTQHAPGPWAISDPAEKQSWQILCLNINEYGNFNVCEIRRDTFGLTEQDKATARLIAAAPELLETCKAMLKSLESARFFNPNAELKRGMTAARAAIAKAEGSAQ